MRHQDVTELKMYPELKLELEPKWRRNLNVNGIYSSTTLIDDLISIVMYAAVRRDSIMQFRWSKVGRTISRSYIVCFACQFRESTDMRAFLSADV